MSTSKIHIKWAGNVRIFQAFGPISGKKFNIFYVVYDFNFGNIHEFVCFLITFIRKHLFE